MIPDLLLTIKVMALIICHNRRAHRRRTRLPIQIRHETSIELLRIRARLVERGLGDGVVLFEEGEDDDVVLFDAGEEGGVVGELAGAADYDVEEFGVAEAGGVGLPVGG